MLLHRWLWLAVCGALVGCLDPSEPGALVPKTVMEDPALPRIEVNGTVLHAVTFGEPGDPLVIVLHGGPGGADFRSLLPLSALADDGYFVVFWDQRGTGLSQRHDADVYTYDRVLEDLRQVIEHYISYDAQPVMFIGHSWGAMYATWFINEYGTYGGRVRGAVLSEPGAFTKAQLDSFMQRLFASYDFLGEQLNDVSLLGQFMTPADHVRADYLLAIQSAGGAPTLHLDPSKPEPHERLGAVANQAMFALTDKQGFDWTTHLGSFAPTVLFLRGSLNEVANLEHQQALASSYPHHEMVTMDGVGHEMVWERPVEYLEHVRAYFGRIGFSGGAR